MVYAEGLIKIAMSWMYLLKRLGVIGRTALGNVGFALDA